MSSPVRNFCYIKHKTCVKITEWGRIFGHIVPYVFWHFGLLIQIVVALTRYEGHFVRYGASPRAAIQSGGKISAGCCVFGCRKWLITMCNNNMIRVTTTAWIILHTEKTIFLFPFTLNGIWSWWQSPRSYPTVTTIISHSMWKEMEIVFSV